MICGATALAAASIYSVEGLAGLFGRLIFGVLADRLGVRRVIVGGLVLQAVGIYTYIYVSELPQFYALAAVLGLAVGLLAIRRQGICFAMITLAMAQMIYFVCLQVPFTGGEDGLQGVPRRALFGVLPLGNVMVLYYTVLAIFVAVFLLIVRIVHSPYGQVLKAIRENEPRAISLGYEVNRYKLLAFVLSTAIAGLAGSLKTLVLGFATLSDVHWSMSGEVILMSLLGGVGTFLGPLFGAGIVIALQDMLADKVGEWVTVIIGVIFVVCVLAFRKGVVGELLAWRDRRKTRPA
jgi:branched-chain amino acid transport system permease protein